MQRQEQRQQQARNGPVPVRAGSIACGCTVYASRKGSTCGISSGRLFGKATINFVVLLGPSTCTLVFAGLKRSASRLVSVMRYCLSNQPNSVFLLQQTNRNSIFQLSFRPANGPACANARRQESTTFVQRHVLLLPGRNRLIANC